MGGVIKHYTSLWSVIWTKALIQGAMLPLVTVIKQTADTWSRLLRGQLPIWRTSCRMCQWSTAITGTWAQDFPCLSLWKAIMNNPWGIHFFLFDVMHVFNWAGCWLYTDFHWVLKIWSHGTNFGQTITSDPFSMQCSHTHIHTVARQRQTESS